MLLLYTSQAKNHRQVLWMSSFAHFDCSFAATAAALPRASEAALNEPPPASGGRFKNACTQCTLPERVAEKVSCEGLWGQDLVVSTFNLKDPEHAFRKHGKQGGGGGGDGNRTSSSVVSVVISRFLFAIAQRARSVAVRN